jgi:hypothetical protein
MPNLSVVYLRDIQRFLAVGGCQSEVNGGRGLQLHLQQLVSDVRKLSVILVVRIAQRFADKAMKSRAPIHFLIVAAVVELAPYKRFETFK